MKSRIDSSCFNFEDAFYGTSTLGERGQLVIPAEARAELEMTPGDKILIMRHPIHKGLMLFKLAHAKQFLDDFSTGLQLAEDQADAHILDSEEQNP